MITIKTHTEPIIMRVIPRIKDLGVIKARLINEKTEELIELEDIEYEYIDGFLYFQLDYIFDKDLSTFSIDLIYDNSYVHRGRIQVINNEEINEQTEIIYV